MTANRHTITYFFNGDLNDLDKLHSQKAHYPFLATVSAVLEKIKPICQQQSAWFFTELPKQEEALYELKENITAPVLRFMNGAAKSLI